MKRVRAKRGRCGAVHLSVVALLVAALFGGAASVAAQDVQPSATGPRLVLAPELGSSFLTFAVDWRPQSLTAQAGFRVGVRWRRWGIFAHTEAAIWQTPEGGGIFLQAAANFAIGVEHLYHRDRVRTAFAGGVSILLRGNELDRAGTTGFFADIRPAGLRWHRGGVWGLDPIHMTIVMPVLSGIPLVDIQFRTTVYYEI